MLQSEENPPNSALHLRKAALAYAARGWYVFPCLVGGKTPVFKGGFHGATTNPAVIERWWGGQALQYRHRYWPISGLWVVDIDPGGALDGLPLTLESATGRSRHLYFTTRQHLSSTAGVIGLGIDTRGEGGYVLAPPSVHPSGATYRWTVTVEPRDL